MLTAAVRGWAGSSNAALDVDHFAFGSARGTTEAIVSLVDAVRNPSRDSSPGDHTTTSAPPFPGAVHDWRRVTSQASHGVEMIRKYAAPLVATHKATTSLR